MSSFGLDVHPAEKTNPRAMSKMSFSGVVSVGKKAGLPLLRTDDQQHADIGHIEDQAMTSVINEAYGKPRMDR